MSGSEPSTPRDRRTRRQERLVESLWEHTLAEPIHCTGVGVHTGKPVDLVLRPAAPGTGIVFVRRDQGQDRRFPARSEWVIDTTLATTLGNAESRLSTVEHVISALAGMQVDNCTVEVFGPEVPIMDGSSAPFVYMIEQAGRVAQKRLRRRLVIRKPVAVREGDRFLSAIPSREFKVSVEVEFDHPAIGKQSIRALSVTPRTYARSLAPARTFGFLEDVKRLQAKGLALGGSMQNAIVLDTARVLNPEGLRFRDEFARHKALDLVGDLALLGLPVQGHFKAVRSGHSLHQALVAELRANPSCWSIEVGAVPADAADTAGESEAALALPRLNPASS
jgi:UDP-3-O-[3-hydroxymyristoyl] N-acetylglucosamine deacetylase